MGLYLLAQLSLCGVVISIEDSLLKSQPSFFGLFLANTTKSIAAADQQADGPELRAARLALVQHIAALPDGLADLALLKGFLATGQFHFCHPFGKRPSVVAQGRL